MALHLRGSRVNFISKLTGVFIAVFALFIQPVVALDLPAAFAASPNEDQYAKITAATVCETGKVKITITGENKTSAAASGTYELNYGDGVKTGVIAAGPNSTTEVVVPTDIAEVETGDVQVEVTTPRSLSYTATYNELDCSSKPVIGTTTPGDSETIYKSDATYTISANVTDADADLDTVKWKLTGPSNQNSVPTTFTKQSGDSSSAKWSGTYNLASLTTGIYTLKFTATDAAGNQETKTINSIQLKDTPPATSNLDVIEVDSYFRKYDSASKPNVTHSIAVDTTFKDYGNVTEYRVELLKNGTVLTTNNAKQSLLDDINSNNGSQITRSSPFYMPVNSPSTPSWEHDNYKFTSDGQPDQVSVTFVDKGVTKHQTVNLTDANLSHDGQSYQDAVTRPVYRTANNGSAEEYFDTIQEAIDDGDTVDGDTIEVLAGTHDPFDTPATGKDNLTIRAAEGTEPQITGSHGPDGRILDLRANNATIKGLTVIGNGTGVAFSLFGTGQTIEGNIVDNVNNGIATLTQFSVGNNTVKNNKIKNSVYGLVIQNAENTFTNNNIDVSKRGVSSSAPDNIVKYNNFSIVDISNGGSQAKANGVSLNAEENWWSSKDGIQKAIGAVDSDPWLCGPFETSPGTATNSNGCDPDPNGENQLNVSGTLYRDNKLNDCDNRTECLDRSSDRLEDWEVRLYKEDSNQDWQQIKTAQTNADGVYNFGAQKEAGTYYVCFVQRTGWTQSKQTWSGSGYKVDTPQNTGNSSVAPYCAKTVYTDNKDRSWKQNIGNVDTTIPSMSDLRMFVKQSSGSYIVKDVVKAGDAVRIEVKATDNESGVKYVEFRVKNANGGGYVARVEKPNLPEYGNTYRYEFTVPSDGKYIDTHQPITEDQNGLSYWARAYDKAGNYGNGTTTNGLSDNFTYDNTAPEKVTGIHIEQNGNNLGTNAVTNQRAITVDWDDSNNDANFDHYEYQADRNKTTPYEYTTKVTASERSGNIRDEDGVYNYRVRAIDAAGNAGLWSDWVSVILDREAPDASISTTPATNNGETFSDPVQVTGSVDEEKNIKSHWFEITDPNGDKTYEYNMNTTDKSYSFTLDTSAGDGEYVVRYVATDRAGNRSDSTSPTLRAITIDNEPTDGGGSEDGTGGDENGDGTGTDDSDGTPSSNTDEGNDNNTNTGTSNTGGSGGNTTPSQSTTSTPGTISPLAQVAFNQGLTGANGSTTTGSVLGAATTGNESDDDDRGDVLGTNSPSTDGSVKNSAVAQSPEGWKLFGIAWYWILLLLAALAGLWWFLVARRNAAEDANL